tara:strand:- start:3466 stop:3612 length:147 start_codon:yes stop_codon:yes gene_type:complete
VISLEKCNEVLNKSEQKYTQEQIKVIRDTLYQFAEIVYESKKELNEKS